MIKNQIKTVVLLGLLTGILLWIGSFFGQSGLLFALILAIVINFGSFYYSDKIVLRMYRAKELNKSHWLYKMVKELAKDYNLPKPKVYIVPSNTPNAFAVGRNPKHSAVAFNQGIINLLSKEELKGVTAHELSHIKNRDTLIATIAATIAGVITYIAFFARFAAIFGGMRNRNSGNMFELLFLAILTPIIATIIQLAISRSREYLADHSGAKLIKNGNSLANALEKLESSNKRHPMMFGNKATASLFIVNPFSGRNLIKLFSTHPPMNERVKRLKAMKF